MWILNNSWPPLQLNRMRNAVCYTNALGNHSILSTLALQQYVSLSPIRQQHNQSTTCGHRCGLRERRRLRRFRSDSGHANTYHRRSYLRRFPIRSGTQNPLQMFETYKYHMIDSRVQIMNHKKISDTRTSTSFRNIRKPGNTHM